MINDRGWEIQVTKMKARLSEKEEDEGVIDGSIGKVMTILTTIQEELMDSMKVKNI